MTDKYILGIDQSTSGTKAILFNQSGKITARSDQSHEQIINELGWVEHDPEEIYNNTLKVVREVIEKADISKKNIVAVGISNQRETAVSWDKISGKPIYNAVVWQCKRGEAICKRIEDRGFKEMVKDHTGLPLSPYFSAAKFSWILENVPDAKAKANEGMLCFGTMDSWLLYKLTHGKYYKTDYSNASRTQMFNIKELTWDREVCGLFGISINHLPEVCDSNAYFGTTDFEGYLDTEIPIHGILGDSHGALFAQGCLKKGMIKATYGTGSSVMMNTGETPFFSKAGLVTSLAWGMDGKINYVLEGNINYTGAVIKWMQEDLKLVSSPGETSELAMKANTADVTYVVPAFTGLGAPYWDTKATGIISGITRTTKRPEIVRAGLDCIAYQVTDIVRTMSEESGISIEELRVDGGPTKNSYLMQFQSDILNISVQVPDVEELSGMGAAYAAGIAVGIFDKDNIFQKAKRTTFVANMEKEERESKYKGWKEAVRLVLTK